MEFWVGLLIGMHLGKFFGEILEKHLESSGIIDHETHEMLDQIEDLEEDVVGHIAGS
jgi:hypothetical protein